MTKDIDALVSDDQTFIELMELLEFKKEGRNWYRDDLEIFIEIPAPDSYGYPEKKIQINIDETYKVIYQAPEEAFLDRLRGLVHWKEEDYFLQLQDLWDFRELDIDYIFSKLENEKEEEVLLNFLRFHVYKVQEALYIEQPRSRYIDLSDRSINESNYGEGPFIELKDSICIRPDIKSINKGAYAELIGNIRNNEVIFHTSKENYYKSDSDTGFSINDIYSINGIEATLVDLKKLCE